MESFQACQSRGLKKRILENMECGDRNSYSHLENRRNSVVSAAIGLTSLGTPNPEVPRGPAVGDGLSSAENFASREMLNQLESHRISCGNDLFVNNMGQAQTHGTYPSEPHPMNGKNFPQVLFDIVSDERADIISWLDHGQGFMIHDKARFANEILTHFFDGTKFTSFTRRLKRWNFTRISRGPELGAYYNLHFARGKLSDVHKMRYRITLQNRALAKKKETKEEETTDRQGPSDDQSVLRRPVSPDIGAACTKATKQGHSSEARPLCDNSPQSLSSHSDDLRTVMVQDGLSLDRNVLRQSPRALSDQDFLDLRTRILLEKTLAFKKAEGITAEEPGQVARPFILRPNFNVAIAMQRQQHRQELVQNLNHQDIINSAMNDLRNRMNVATPSAYRNSDDSVTRSTSSLSNLQQKVSAIDTDLQNRMCVAAPSIYRNSDDRVTRSESSLSNLQQKVSAMDINLRNRMGVAAPSIYRNSDDNVTRSESSLRNLQQKVSAIDIEQYARFISLSQNCYRASAA